jgi:photosystem II stability/assembly factor-like uncharacterized protein
MRTRYGRLVGTIGATAVLATSMAVVAPAAQADSRCNKRDHTHGMLWWERTDHYLGNTDSAYGSSYRDYHHTNSDPKPCRV